MVNTYRFSVGPTGDTVMSIRKVKDEFVAECNDCGTEEYGGTIDIKSQSGFREFVQLLKDQGWRIKKDDDSDEWKHYCPECKSTNL